MSDPSEEPRSPQADLEREIREGRKFTLAEAIGRLAGPGAMKGISPATQKQQAEASIETFLRRHLSCPGGVLTALLLQRVKESELFLNNLDQPLTVLAGFAEQILSSDYALQELVRQADFEWGRLYGERPYFQKPGAEPHADDPYTFASVRADLSRLIERLNVGEGG